MTVALAAAAIAVAVTPAQDPHDEAPPAVQEALRAAKQGRHQEAIDTLARAYEANPRQSGLLFVKGHIELAAGDCEAALVSFERFLATSPSEADTSEANDAIRACKETLHAEEPPNEEPAPPGPVEPEAPQDPPPARHSRRPDALGHALLWPGVGLAASGVALIAASLQRRERAESGTEQRYIDEIDGAQTMNRVGWVLTSVGSGLLIGGIVRLSWVARNGQAPPRTSLLGPVRF